MQRRRRSSVAACAPTPTLMAYRWILRCAAASVVLGGLFLALPAAPASAAEVPDQSTVQTQASGPIPLPLPTAIPLPLPTSLPLPHLPIPLSLPTSIPLPLPTSIPLPDLGGLLEQPTTTVSPPPPGSAPPAGPSTPPGDTGTVPTPGAFPDPKTPDPSASPSAGAPPVRSAGGSAGSSVAQQRASSTGQATNATRTPAQVVTAGARWSAFPLFLLVILGGFLAVQRWIDRADPKLAGSAAWPERDLRFD